MEACDTPVIREEGEHLRAKAMTQNGAAGDSGTTGGKDGGREKREPKRRVRDFEVAVAEVRMETKDCATLFLAAGEPMDYEAGHFITIDPHQFKFLEHFIAHLEDQKGQREKPRAYSLGSAPHEEHLIVTVKEETYESGQTPYPPLLSPLLAYHDAGSSLTVRGFTGAYTFPKDIRERTDNILHVCAGSGIVPNRGLIMNSIHRGDGLRHVLLFSNKTRDDIIYFRDFQELQERHPDKLEVLHCITREDPAGIPNFRRGRIDADLLRAYIPDPGNCFVFSCGPGITPHARRAAKERGERPAPQFVETMAALLTEVGLDKKQIKQESW